MLGLLTERLYEPLLPLAGALGSASDLQEHIDGGYAWVPGDRQLPYKALLAFDAFIFEFRSAYEILGKFLVAFAEKVLGAPVKERDLLDVLAARGIATEWVAFLREHRKLFFHEQAPWIGYRVRSVDPFDGDPVFLVNVDSEPDDEDAISTRDLGLI